MLHSKLDFKKQSAGKASVGVADLPGASMCTSSGMREESKDVGREGQEEEATRHVKHCTRRKIKRRKLLKGF